MAKKKTVQQTNDAYTPHKWGVGGLNAMQGTKQLQEMDNAIAAAGTAAAGKLDATKAAVASVGGLVAPSSTPTEKLATGVDESNSQVMYKFGEGITVEGDTSPYTIKASGGGHLYNHSVQMVSSDQRYYGLVTVTTQRSTPYSNLEDIVTDLKPTGSGGGSGPVLLIAGYVSHADGSGYATNIYPVVRMSFDTTIPNLGYLSSLSTSTIATFNPYRIVSDYIRQIL